MPQIGVFSLHGSPGATTVALATAVRLHHHGVRALFLEADPDGGVVAARFDLPLAPNLTDLAAAARRPLEADEILGYAQSIGNGLPAVLSHPSGDQTRVALSMGAASIATALARLAATTVIDLGRWRADSAARPLLDSAGHLLLVLRPTLEQAVQVLHLVDALDAPQRLTLVVVGSRPYSARQVAETTGVPVLASIPDLRDEPTVNPFALEARRRDRLPTAVAELVDALQQRTQSPSDSAAHTGMPVDAAPAIAPLP